VTRRAVLLWKLVLPLVVLAAAPAPLAAQAPPRRGRLIVTVSDQTGLVIPNATVRVTSQDAPAAGGPAKPLATGGTGVAVADDLPDGRYTIEVEFPGFETAVLRDVRVRGGSDTRRRITLQIQRVEEGLTVSRDRQSSSLDPKGSAFSSVLTREQIEALPDDPEEMEAVLKAMSPPGSVLRVDGFTGGRLPPKSQIRSIRIPRMDMFAAQNHGGMSGMMFIDIMTTPGMGPLRGSTDFSFLDDAMNARNAFTPEKADEQLRQYGFNLSGTIKPGKTSFSLYGGGGYQYTSPNLFAVAPDGTTYTDTRLQQPRNSFNLSGRVDHAITKDHAVRLSVDFDTSKTENLGVGGYNLFSRAYTSTSTNTMVRLTENGPIGRRMFTETRAQFRLSDSGNESSLEAPTIRVNDAFTGGGAQMRGGQRGFTFEVASDLDYVRGAHSWRTGALVEGGSFSSDDIINYLGTYTFASLADYNAGRPSAWSRRTGDPNITYSTVQAAVYVQDDWRIARSLLLTGGIRYGVQNHVSDYWNLSPRATFAWSPLRSGNLTIRGSYGYFYDWVAGDLYKQTLLFDGVRQREINIVDPSYPIPGEAGTTPPTNRYLWSDDLSLPTAHRANVGVDRNVSKNGRFTTTYSLGWGRDLLRGRNLNAPVGGIRPNPALANDVALVSDASSTSHAVTLMYSLVRMDWKRTFFNVNYTWSRNRTDTTGAFTIPASGDDLDTEWGPGPNDILHRAGGSFSMQPVKNMTLGVNVRASSGLPYNITTGRDDNGDGLFTDRPAGVSRNSARGAIQIDLGGRLSYAWGFGKPRQAAGGGGNAVMITIGGGGGGLAPGFGGGAEDKRYRLEVYISGQNLLNRVNYTAYSFVLTSPFYGAPVAAAQPRKLQVGARFGF
jgi:hypothetical protein